MPGHVGGHPNETIALKGWTMRTNFDFSPLLRSSIGFENLNRLLDIATRAAEGDTSFPPYNIEKLGDDAYRITMAVAGFTHSELDITVQENTLVVTGKAADEAQPAQTAQNGRTFLHRGIAKRAFERRFQLADVIKVTGASFENGLLNIDLQREVPEHKKPRKVEIGDNDTPVIEGQAA
jgi:molecular chaperone IbpA